MMYCKQTQTPYNKLSEEEKHWLMKIAQESKLAKSHVSQRGKTETRKGLDKFSSVCYSITVIYNTVMSEVQHGRTE